MTYLVTNDVIDDKIDIVDLMDALETMFDEMGAGRAITNSREDVLSPVPDREEYEDERIQESPVYHGLKSMGGVVPKFEVGAIRINSDIIAWPQRKEGRFRHKIPAADGQYTGLVLAFSTRTGEPLAIFPDGLLQAYRVAGTSALGVDYLAREDVSRVGMLGAGHQARAHAVAIDAVRSFDELLVYAPTPESRTSFAEEVSDLVDPTVRAVSDPQRVFEGADIVQCATSSTSPVFELEWIESGTHLGFIRQFEPPDAIWQSERFEVFAQSWSPITQIEEYVGINERTIPTKNVNNYIVEGEESVPKFHNRREAPVCDWDTVVSLGEIIHEESSRPVGDDGRTVFFNRGMGIQFAAVAKVVLDWCERGDKEIQTIPTELLTQPYRP